MTERTRRSRGDGTIQLELLSRCHGENCVHFRAGKEFHGRVLHDVSRGDRGLLHGARIPADGVLHVDKSNSELLQHCRAAGFVQMREGAPLVDPHEAKVTSGSTAANMEKGDLIASALFRKSSLQVLHAGDGSGDANFLKALHTRAGTGEPQTSWCPKTERIKYLMQQGFSRGEAERML